MGNGASLSDDGFGNISYSQISQSFKILNGQAKMSKSLTASKTENLDGSKSWMGLEGKGQAMEVNYRYYGEDGFPADKAQKRFLGTVAMASGNGASLSDDGFGNLTNSSILQDFKILNGQAKISRSATASKTENVDGSKSWMGMEGKGEAMVVEYSYYGEAGFPADKSTKKNLGSVARSSGKGKSISDDGFGNVTTSDIGQEFKVVNGQAKMSRSVTTSKTENADGSKSWMGMEGKGQQMEVTYRYYGEDGLPADIGKKKFLGSVAMATGNGRSVSDDGFGNVTTSDIGQEFKVVNGQAKMSRSVTSSKTENIDGSKTWMGAEGKGQAMTVSYSYYGEEGYSANVTQRKYMGSVAASQGEGTSITDDGFGNITTSLVKQEFKVINGQAKISKSITSSQTENLDGSFSYTGWKDKDGVVQGKAMTVEYRYTGNQKFVRLVQDAEFMKTAATVKRESFGEQKIDFAPSGEIVRGEFKVGDVAYTVLEDENGRLTATYKDENGMGQMADVELGGD
ncbi:MAG: hypothetical protein HYY63_00795, partial [Elusimicrobia bacterium]|nr:hypothetical protein [Elusimicrobiota bacterium]